MVVVNSFLFVLGTNGRMQPVVMAHGGDDGNASVLDLTR